MVTLVKNNGLGPVGFVLKRTGTFNLELVELLLVGFDNFKFDKTGQFFYLRLVSISFHFDLDNGRDDDDDDHNRNGHHDDVIEI